MWRKVTDLDGLETRATPKIPEKPAKGFIVFVRYRLICATPFKKRSPAGRPKIKPLPRSNFPQYEEMQGYESQREVAVRRTYREMMCTPK